MKKLNESIGRELVGASNFSNRSKVSHQVLLKYPTPKELSVALQQMAKDSTDSKVQKKCLELAVKCNNIDIRQYPQFVDKIVGLNKLWSLAAKTIGLAAAAAGTTYLVRTMAQAADDESFKNAKGIGNSTKALLNKTGSIISDDATKLANSTSNTYNNIKNWGKNKITDTAKYLDQKSGAAADRAAMKADTEAGLKNAANERAAMKADTEAGLKNAANERAAMKADTEANFKNAAADRAAMKADTEANFKNAANERAKIQSDAEAGLKNAAAERAAMKAEADKIHKWHDSKINANKDNISKNQDQIYKNSRRMNGLTPTKELPSGKINLDDVKQPYIDAYNKGKEIYDNIDWNDVKEPYVDAYDTTKNTILNWGRGIKNNIKSDISSGRYKTM